MCHQGVESKEQNVTILFVMKSEGGIMASLTRICPTIQGNGISGCFCYNSRDKGKNEVQLPLQTGLETLGNPFLARIPQ